MTIYRIDRLKYIPTALSGLGAARHGGRWNFKDTPAVYASESRSLAMLEILVHTRTTALVPKDRVIISINIPDKDFFLRVAADELPPHWDAIPRSPHALQKLFEEHCIEGTYGGLKIPSVVMPEEYNFVLNPMHTDFNKMVTIESTSPLYWDARLS